MKTSKNKNYATDNDDQGKNSSPGEIKSSKFSLLLASLFSKKQIKEIFIKSALIIVIIVMYFIFTAIEPRFASFNNMMNIMRQISFNGILVVGMVIVIIAGETNLSVGSIAALTCVSTFLLILEGFPIIVVLLISLLIGAVCGAISGVLVAYGKVKSFILTLGVGISIRGIAMLMCGGRQVSGIYPPEFATIASGFSLGLPNLFWFLIIIVIIGDIIMRHTVFGRRIYSVGGNAEAARVSGINVEFMKFSAFVISGLLAGLVGFLLSSRTTLGDPTVAEGFDLKAVATSVIGGASLSGGVGTVIGGLLGAIIMGTMSNGFSFLGIPPLYQNVMEGIIVVAAVFWDTKSKSMRR